MKIRNRSNIYLMAAICIVLIIAAFKTVPAYYSCPGMPSCPDPCARAERQAANYTVSSYYDPILAQTEEETYQYWREQCLRQNPGYPLGGEKRVIAQNRAAAPVS